MAGHSHWSKIKRAKGANDAKRGKIWSKIARKIIIAAKNGGDPRDNLNLRYTIDEAKAVNMPRDTIEKAIMKGTGELGAENYENVTYEAYAPGGVAMIIEGLTNNPSRTAPDLRSILEKGGGNLAKSGAVAFQFTKQGVITIKADAVDEDKLMEIALDAGAEDVKNEGEVLEVITTPTMYPVTPAFRGSMASVNEPAAMHCNPAVTILRAPNRPIIRHAGTPLSAATKGPIAITAPTSAAFKPKPSAR